MKDANMSIGSLKALTRGVAVAALFALLFTENAAFPRVTAAPATVSSDGWTYADLVSLLDLAPVAARVRITSATPLTRSRAEGTAIRTLIEAQVVTLIRADRPLSAHVRYLADVMTDSRGRPAKLKKAEVLVVALPVAGHPDQLRLVGNDAQLSWSQALEARIRAIATELVSSGSEPPITGIASAFHVAGTVPRESETQIFLTTATAAPVSLSILRRPGEEPRWAPSFGELVDDSAGPPVRDTLAWYRLACSLPQALPNNALAELNAADAAAAIEDYAFVLESLGQCTRFRKN